MNTELNEVTINGKTYIEKGAQQSPAKKLDGLDYVIVRTYSAGVFAGYLKHRNGRECEVLQARRLWYWDGAASLSELSQHGVSKPENCKFPEEVPTVILTEAIEILPCTEKARLNIAEVETWEAK